MDSKHQTPSKKGVLLINLGSPDSTSVRAVRKYLHQFLMDKHVLDVPYLLRKFIVTCTILPTRPKETAAAYQKIWGNDGSPLITISREVQTLLEDQTELPLALGMRYGNPSTAHALKQLKAQADPSLEKILVILLYPHYANSSYGTAVEETQRCADTIFRGVKLTFVPPFYDDADYIRALVANSRKYLETDYDHLLFSYHGLPERHIRSADPTGKHCLNSELCCETDSPAHQTCYRAQVLKTTHAFVQEANIPEHRYSVAFQSRLGRDPWLQPATDMELPRLAQKGIKKLLVICPSFVSDCLETLEEIGIRGKADFIAAGGEDLQLIPCLNTHPQWISTLNKWCS